MLVFRLDPLTFYSNFSCPLFLIFSAASRFDRNNTAAIRSLLPNQRTFDTYQTAELVPSTSHAHLHPVDSRDLASHSSRILSAGRLSYILTLIAGSHDLYPFGLIDWETYLKATKVQSILPSTSERITYATSFRRIRACIVIISQRFFSTAAGNISKAVVADYSAAPPMLSCSACRYHSPLTASPNSSYSLRSPPCLARLTVSHL